MSRQIDMSKPLSPEDREWLLANNGEATVQANDAAHGVVEEPGALSPSESGMTGGEPSLESDRTYPTGLVPNSSGDLDAARRAAQLESAMGSNPAGVGDSVESVDLTVETDENPYDDWKGDELRRELGKRELAKSGTNPELVERLRADDKERAEGDTPAE